MSKAGAVEAKGVVMPMIDDQAEADEDLPRAIPHQTKTPLRPKSVQEAYMRMKSTNNAADLCVAFTLCCGLLCAGICMTVFLAALSVVHIFLLIVGAIHVYDCRAERFIPIFLIVVGVFAILRACLNWYYAWCHPKIKKPETDEEVPKPSPFSNIINLFLLIWLICGAIWVFRTNPVFHDATDPNYCDKLTYYTAYVYVIVSFAMMALTLVIGCCMCCCVLGTMMGIGASDESARARPKANDNV